MSVNQKEKTTKISTDSIEKEKNNENDKFDSFHKAFVENVVSNKVSDEKDNRTDALVDSIKEFADKSKQEKLKKEAFQSYFTKFINKTSDKELYAKVVDRKIYCRISDTIKVKDNLLNTENNKTYVINSISPDRVNVDISYAGINFSYWCNEVEISFLSVLEDNPEIPSLLSQLEEGINATKVNFLNKKKSEALKLFGFFKNVVINKEQEEILFKNFNVVLNSLDPNLAELANKIISLM